MIELFEQDIRTLQRQSSKGNQLKWTDGHYWYKADYTGYEGLAEYMVSHLLMKSTLEGKEYIVYDFEDIRYRRQIFRGVKSSDFREEDWQIITLERLFQQFLGHSLNQSIWSIENPEERLIFLVEQTKRITGLKDFGIYMNKLMTIDAFFLNEDRHFHNIAVLMNGQHRFAYCPIFDNGAALLADTTMDYPLSEDMYELMDAVQAKTFSRDFSEQLDISEKLYGGQLHFTFTKSDVETLLAQAAAYSDKEKERVRDLVFYQMHKYGYLMR